MTPVCEKSESIRGEGITARSFSVLKPDVEKHIQKFIKKKEKKNFNTRTQYPMISL